MQLKPMESVCSCKLSLEHPNQNQQCHSQEANCGRSSIDIFPLSHLTRKKISPDSDPANWHIQDQFSSQEY